MNKLAMAFFLLAAFGVAAFAQASGEEYEKNEFYVGFSNQQIGNRDRVPFNGFQTSYVRNVNRFFGVKADFSAAYRNLDFDITTNPGIGTASPAKVEYNNSIYNVLGGVQIKDNASKARFKPFAHALAGVAHNRQTTNVTCSLTASSCGFQPFFKSSDTGFGGAFGGGLDIKINNRVEFRAIQIDYNPVYSESRVNNNIRFGVGFVFK